MMRTPLILSAVALAALSACDNQTIVQEPTNPLRNEIANAPPVALPPSISASVSFRCKDNSLVYVDFFDGTFVNFRTQKGTPPTVLRAPAAGQPYVADGYSLSGTPAAIELTQPGKAAQSCSA